MGRSKNSNTDRGNKGTDRKKVLVLQPKTSNPRLLARVWKFEDEL